jgi:hypothetical protein
MNAELKSRAEGYVSTLKPLLAIIDDQAPQLEKLEELKGGYLLPQLGNCRPDGAGEQKRAELERGLAAVNREIELRSANMDVARKEIAPYLTSAGAFAKECGAPDELVLYVEGLGNDPFWRACRLVEFLESALAK